MKKRILMLLLSLVLIVSAVTPMALAAAPATFKVQIPDELPAIGQSFDVTITVSGTGGFNRIQFMLNYNDTVLECTKVKKGNAISDFISAQNPHNTANAPGAMLAGADDSDSGKDGTLATISFKVLKSGKPGFELTRIVLGKADNTGIDFTVEGLSGKSAREQHDESGNVIGKEEQKGEGAEQLFTDVPASFWAYEQILEAAEKKLVTGYPDNTFRPNANVTRAQFVLMLWRMAGEPAANTTASFTDTTGGDWYQKALNWSVENGYVNGVGGGKFNPNGNITREQAMTILFRYDGAQSGSESMFTAQYDAHFADSATISSYAKPAVYWAVFKEIMTGKGNNIAPKAPATRAEIAVILLRYLNK